MSGKPTESECLQLSEVLQGACVMAGGARGESHRDTATRHDNPVEPVTSTTMPPINYMCCTSK